MPPPLYYFFRKAVNRLMLALLFLLSAAAALPFFFIAAHALEKGFAALSWELLTELPKAPGEPGGGLANAILGSAVMVGLASLFGIPWGAFLGVCLSEYRFSPAAKALRPVIDLSLSAPSIVIGIFVYTAVVAFFGFSAYAGAAALLIILVPVMAKSSEEILKAAPYHIREAGLALGLPRWKVIMSVLIPGSLAMLLSGAILALARVAGETAPLLFTSLGNQFFSRSLSEPTASLPVQIYELAKSGLPDWESMAWGGALLLMGFVFLVNFFMRLAVFLTGSWRGRSFGGHGA